MASEKTEKILLVVSQIPSGCVATYGQIARLAGIPRNARQVGQVLGKLTGQKLPWHRVVNAKGEISHRGNSECETLQRELLEAESVEFDPRGRVLLSRNLWKNK